MRLMTYARIKHSVSSLSDILKDVHKHVHQFSGDEVARIVRSRYGEIDYDWGIKSASTDFVSELTWYHRHILTISGSCLDHREISHMVFPD